MGDCPKGPEIPLAALDVPRMLVLREREGRGRGLSNVHGKPASDESYALLAEILLFGGVLGLAERGIPHFMSLLAH